MKVFIVQEVTRQHSIRQVLLEDTNPAATDSWIQLPPSTVLVRHISWACTDFDHLMRCHALVAGYGKRLEGDTFVGEAAR